MWTQNLLVHEHGILGLNKKSKGIITVKWS
jgi:hypothetical protein